MTAMRRRVLVNPIPSMDLTEIVSFPAKGRGWSPEFSYLTKSNQAFHQRSTKSSTPRENPLKGNPATVSRIDRVKATPHNAMAPQQPMGDTLVFTEDPVSFPLLFD